MTRLIAVALLLCLFGTGAANADEVLGQSFTQSESGRGLKHGGRRAVTSGNPAGLVRSGKTSATAHVDPNYAGRFQAYINDLEQNHGATIRFMGGWRAGRCGLANQHACGQAMDICQYSWGVVDRRCNLPPRQQLAKIARAHGLYEGAEWCRPDTGHVQVRFSGACNRNLYAAVSSWKSRR